MSAHVDADGDCPLAVVPCQYTDIGCKFKVRLHWGVKTISASVLESYLHNIIYFCFNSMTEFLSLFSGKVCDFEPQSH